MAKIPYIKRVAAAALGSIDSILNRWLPGGKRQGQEYVVKNPTRADSQPGSFSINVVTGAWSDFACDAKGGDLVGLVGYLENLNQGAAAEKLAAFLGIEPEEGNPPKRATSDSKKPGNGKPLTNPKESSSIENPGDDGDGWRCVMPVPDDAPKPPVAHPKHGKPSKRYPYLAKDGRVNFYHDRYDKPKGEKKQFSPLTLWEKDGKREWRFKIQLGLRPLYGLPGLLQFPDAECWFTEGEKTAEALQKLLPDHPILCWQGGSQAVEKSDYSPLAGRDCVIFPDYDLPGKKAAGDLVKRLTAAGARSVRVLDVDRLERATGEPLQPGDDAADLVACGWDVGKFAEFLQRDDAFLSDADAGGNQSKQAETATGKPEPEAPQRSFMLTDDAVLLVEQNPDGSFRRRKICSRLEVTARTRTADNLDWGIVCALADPDSVQKRIIIPMRDFSGDGLPVASALLAAGLELMPKCRPLLLEYLQTSQITKRARITNKCGWHGVGDNLAFVLPDRSIGNGDEEWLFADGKPDVNPFTQRGTLKQWKENVSSLCVGNSRLIFVMSAAFASPLLHFIEMESGGFNYRGISSGGKSSSLYAACSMYGAREFLRKWKSTDNALEATALSHNDMLLPLDELKELPASVAVECCYMLANGAGKSRANLNGGARKTAKWRLLFFSSGELSLSQHAAEAGKKTPAGAELRMADIPADAGHGMGCFEDFHGSEDGDTFAKALDAITKKYYGTAFPAFIEQVLKHRETLRDSLTDARQQFGKAVLTAAAAGQVHRVAARFALVGAAGELATDWGVTGWPPGEAMQAAITCFKAWLQAFGGEGAKEERIIIETLRHFIAAHGESRFSDMGRANADDSHAPRTMNRVGFRRKTVDDETEYFIYPESFKFEIFSGMDSLAAGRLLIDKGFMKGGEGRNLQAKIRLPGEGSRRMFHVLPTIWNDIND